MLVKKPSNRHCHVVSVPTANPKQLTDACESVDSPIDQQLLQIDLVRLDRAVQASLCGTENLVLRHQLNVLRRKAPKRVALGSIDRLLLVGALSPGSRVLKDMLLTV